MKDNEIFDLLKQSSGISEQDVIDFRPCSKLYVEYGIPAISDAILIKLKTNGTLIYIPDKDTDGNVIQRQLKDRNSLKMMLNTDIGVPNALKNQRTFL